MDSTGRQAKAGFYLESSNVCHRWPTRPFPSEKGGLLPTRTEMRSYKYLDLFYHILLIFSMNTKRNAIDMV